MSNENNKFQIDIDNLFKQNVNDLSSIKELYRKLEEIEKKITQIKYIDSNLVNKLKKEYEKLKKDYESLKCVILDENIQAKLANDIETINSHLDNIALQIKDKDNIQEKINKAIDKNLNIYSPSIINVDSKIIIDLCGKFNFKINLILKPSNNLEDVILIKNGINTEINLIILDGGNENSKGLIIEDLQQPKINIYGQNFKGTLLYNNGYDEDNNKNRFCEINLKAINCGKALKIGDFDKYITAFGKFNTIFDTSKNGIEFINVNDITIDSIENTFFQVDKTYLTFNKCKSVYIGNCALGGICKQMIDINKSFVHIDKLLMINDKKTDITDYTMNGIKIRSDSLVSTSLTSMVTVNSIDAYDLNNIIDIDNNSNVSFKLIRPHKTNTTVIMKNETSLGLPNYMPCSYETRKDIYFDENNKLHFTYNNKDINIIEQIKKVYDKIDPIINKEKIKIVSGTSNIETYSVTFPKEHISEPLISGLVTQNDYVVFAQSITKTGFNIIVKKRDGSNFNNENIYVTYKSEDI